VNEVRTVVSIDGFRFSGEALDRALIVASKQRAFCVSLTALWWGWGLDGVVEWQKRSPVMFLIPASDLR
jgi:hypothetical protein